MRQLKRQLKTTDGRKCGPPNRKTKPKIEVDASGLTPLDYMLSVAHNPRAKPERRDEMAKAAAPFVHPPIAPIDTAVARLLGTLLAELVKSHGSPEEQ
jgi:hypothetical protein